MVDSGHNLSDVDSPTLLFNDNDACIQWSYNMTSKAARHIELRENSVREWIQSKLLTVKHVSGKINPSDIFTKEMRDGANYRRLRDSFMSRASTFLKGIYNSLHPLSSQPITHTLEAAAQAAHYVPPTRPGMLEILLSHRSFRTPNALSCLSQAGRYILSGASLSGRLL